MNDVEASYPAYLAAVMARTGQALEAEGYRSLVVHAGSLLEVFEDDRSYPFEVHAPFKVWAPLLDVPDCFIHFQVGRPPVLFFHHPQDYWYKPADLPRAYWARHFDILPVADRAAVRAGLPAALGRTAYIGDVFPELASWGLGAVNPRPLMRRLDFHRARKTPYELACLRAASRLGARGHLAAAQAFAAGATEFEIELAFLRACGQREQELPYNPIIALNESGAVLHYQVLAKDAPARRNGLLIDAGAEFAGYASDITRTYSAGDRDFAELIARMDALQQSLCKQVRAGVDWRDIHMEAHALVASVLRDAGITTCSAEECVATGISRVFLPHGIGHLLGLEVHDAGGFMAAPEGGDIPKPDGHPSLRLTRVLEDGFVVTMEPGIYFIEQLLGAARADARARHINWARVDSLRPFGGIRIEDDLAVTAAGCENLTRDAFAAVIS
ncbi:MAG TPA: Xaa-Pro dipeptidase [Steroidobacteraceae bacterium]|nr:Xaa-Pro dipeptidase [Steroidobacteraceae bacterium]